MAKAEAMKAETSTALETPVNQEFLAERPEHIGTGGRRGLENQKLDNIVLPRLAVCQAMTPQRKRTDPNFIEGLKEGDLFNTVSGKIYGTSVKVIPIHFWMGRIFFKPMDEGGGIVCMSPRAEHCSLNNGGPCQHSSWGADGGKPECSELYNFLCYLPEHGDQVMWSAKSTAIKAAKQLGSLIRLRNADMFAGGYTLTTAATPGKQPGQEFYTFGVKPAGWVSKDLYEKMALMYDAIKPAVDEGRVETDTTGMAGEGNEDFPYGAHAARAEM